MTRLIGWILVALLALGSPAFSQSIPIHGHWQKAAYAGPTDCATPISSQGHWGAASLTDAMMHQLGIAHTHLELTCPQPWRETTMEAFPQRGQILLFHVDGHVNAARVEGAPFLDHVIWDATGTTTPPVMNGDPMGIVTFGFTAWFNPALSVPNTEANTWTVPDHGWWEPTMQVQTLFTNGDSTITGIRMPVFSVKDRTQPIPWWAQHFMLRAFVFPTSLRSNPVDGFGTSISEYVDTYLPILAPLTAPFIANASVYNYGLIPKIAAVEGCGNFILNPDLHNGIPGTTLRRACAHGEFGFPMVVTFDPATFAPGPNKFSLTWDQTAEGVEGIEHGVRMTSLLVFSIPADDGLPHPLPPAPQGVELCDRADNNNNGLVDEGCDAGTPPPPQPPPPPPPPPPPSMWLGPVSGTMQPHVTIPGRWFWCQSGQACGIVVKEP